jgi:HEAT repeat protein
MTNTVDTKILIAALDDPDRSMRHEAAIALGGVHKDEAADALVAHLGAETDCFVREALTWATVQAGERAVPGVLAQLRSPEAGVRMQAAHVLSKIGDPAHAVHLVPVVADADPQVAVKAYRAAANTGHPDVLPALAGRLGDGDLEQRDALTSAFATLGETGIDTLVAALGDASADVRAHAADTLGHLGTPLADAAASALAGLLSDEDADVRFAAVSALGELDPAGASAGLKRAEASADPVVSRVARHLLGRPAAS